jgi:hypothetical protein
MRRIAVAALTVLALTMFAGCPFLDGQDSDGNGDNTPPTTIAGTWSGTLACITTDTLDELVGNPRPGSRDLTITFDDQYLPTGLPIWGFSLAFDQTTTRSAVGESETFEFAANFPYREVTLVVTITAATYSESGATVLMDLQHDAAGPNLTEQGTGTMTIEATIEGDSLTFSGLAEYVVTQITEQGTFEATETINCTGTLTGQ